MSIYDNQLEKMANLDIAPESSSKKDQPPKHNEISYTSEDIMAMNEEICTLAKSLAMYAYTENDIVQGFLYKAFNGARDSLLEAKAAITEGLADDSGDNLVTPESLEELASLASELDKTGDPWLMKQAAVLDEILLTIGADKADVTAARRAQDEEILRIKSLAGKEETNNPYTAAKAAHDKFNQVAETKKALDKIKTYRPMEAILSTRTCPDHPGAQMARIGESTYQCSLDKGIYNYENGYTTMKGNHVPGGDVSNQTQGLNDRPNEFTSFDTRESKLNPIN